MGDTAAAGSKPALADGSPQPPKVLASPIPSSDSTASAFHSQLDHIANPPPQAVNSAGPYSPQPYDMSRMAAALPHPSQHPVNPQGQYSRVDVSSGLPPSFQMPPGPQFLTGRPLQFDPATIARMQQQQQQQYMGPPFYQHSSMTHRPPTGHQGQAPYNPVDPYGYGIPPMQMAQLDPRFAAHIPFGLNTSLPDEYPSFMRRSPEPAPIPSYPRGPPRKPKQSGFALWVGNLPPAATVTDLKDHFSRDATMDIESLFLISKSNCAFVNYRSEAACTAAMNRFHDSRFNGVRLVCRLRRGTSASSDTPPTAESPVPVRETTSVSQMEASSPTIVGSVTPGSTTRSADPATVGNDAERANEKYFIVKSLTVQDLEASVRNGTWATQSHNETTLNRAFEESDNVFLIFSANKSGEYFGYARMSSTISGEPVNLGSTAALDEPLSPGVPQSIPTPATATAPRGRIIDDSARGTIFWEAERSDTEGDESTDKEGGESSDGQNWGHQFSIEWLSTTRLPFYRTRGLRNPWNANREVKIARDGTELEPSVGRRLVQMFHRPPPSPTALHSGMPY